MNRLLTLLCLLLLVGCDSGDVFDAVIAERVRISDEQPPIGVVGRPYSFRITATMENSSMDSEYDYRFHLIDGTVPPGTEFRTHRKTGDDYALIEGIPTVTGSFTFSVYVRSITLEDELIWNMEHDGNTQVDPNDEGIYTIVVR